MLVWLCILRWWPINRWCTFRLCVTHTLDLRWRQVNITMWPTCFGIDVWIASTKFLYHTPSNMIWSNLYLFILEYVVSLIYGITFGIWNIGFKWHSSLHCNFAFALSFLVFIWICVYAWRHETVLVCNTYWEKAMWLHPSYHLLGMSGQIMVSMHFIAWQRIIRVWHLYSNIECAYSLLRIFNN